jgi:hypothetical protein
MESELKKDNTPKHQQQQQQQQQQFMDLTDSSSPRSMSTSAPYFLPPRSLSSSPSPRPRRRASQGSASTQRLHYPLSRFLPSKEKAALRIPSFGAPRASSPFASTKIPMSLDTAIPRDTLQSEHPHSLPLTPPADDEDNEHMRWAVDREPKLQVAMDENRDRHSASPTQRQRDGRSSFGAVPGRRSSSDDDVNMSDQDMHDQPPPENWLDNGIKSARKSCEPASNTDINLFSIVPFRLE